MSDDWLTYAQAAERLSLETLKARLGGAESGASDDEVAKTAHAIAAFMVEEGLRRALGRPDAGARSVNRAILPGKPRR